MQLPAKDHPVWRIVNVIVMLTFLTVFLWLNASHFDETEYRSILYMAMAGGGWEWLRHKTNSGGP